MWNSFIKNVITHTLYVHIYTSMHAHIEVYIRLKTKTHLSMHIIVVKSKTDPSMHIIVVKSKAHPSMHIIVVKSKTHPSMPIIVVKYKKSSICTNYIHFPSITLMSPMFQHNTVPL